MTYSLGNESVSHLGKRKIIDSKEFFSWGYVSSQEGIYFLEVHWLECRCKILVGRYQRLKDHHFHSPAVNPEKNRQIICDHRNNGNSNWRNCTGGPIDSVLSYARNCTSLISVWDFWWIFKSIYMEMSQTWALDPSPHKIHAHNILFLYTLFSTKRIYQHLLQPGRFQRFPPRHSWKRIPWICPKCHTSEVEGSIEKLKKDRYLFKPIPMSDSSAAVVLCFFCFLLFCGWDEWKVSFFCFKGVVPCCPSFVVVCVIFFVCRPFGLCGVDACWWRLRWKVGCLESLRNSHSIIICI